LGFEPETVSEPFRTRMAGRFTVMPRALWSGAISFGLVNAPVRMYPTIADHDLHFHLVHEKDASRIRFEKVCAKEDRAVPAEEIVRAFELDDGDLVYLDDEDFAAAEEEGYKLIEIRQFVPYEQLDPIIFEKAFYLGPAEGAEKVYALLVAAMERSGLAAIATFVFHDREYLGCIRVRDDVLTLERMFFADEIRPLDEIAPPRQKVAKEQLELATDLIDRLSGDFDHRAYHDRYRERLLGVIERKAKGETVKAARPEEPAGTADLFAALQASLDEAVRKRSGSRNGGSGNGGERLEDLPRDELLERARRAGVRGRSKMSKAELARAVARAR
jgi:DNA end-binding protein Ku